MTKLMLTDTLYRGRTGDTWYEGGDRHSIGQGSVTSRQKKQGHHGWNIFNFPNKMSMLYKLRGSGDLGVGGGGIFFCCCFFSSSFLQNKT